MDVSRSGFAAFTIDRSRFRHATTVANVAYLRGNGFRHWSSNDLVQKRSRSLVAQLLGTGHSLSHPKVHNLAWTQAQSDKTAALPSVVLYQYEVCPFCCKVRAFLDYHRIPYQVIEVNPISKGELKWSSYKKVPVVKFGDQQLNDSDHIITSIANELNQSSNPRNHPLAGDGTSEELKWREWVNRRFVRIITANIYRSLQESWQTFDYISDHTNFSGLSKTMTRVAGAATMYVIGRRMPKKYEIEGDLREALYAAADEWIKALGEKTYLGGTKPNLGDLAVYGVIKAIQGMDMHSVIGMG